MLVQMIEKNGYTEDDRQRFVWAFGFLAVIGGIIAACGHFLLEGSTPTPDPTSRPSIIIQSNAVHEPQSDKTELRSGFGDRTIRITTHYTPGQNSVVPPTTTEVFSALRAEERRLGRLFRDREMPLLVGGHIVEIENPTGIRYQPHLKKGPNRIVASIGFAIVIACLVGIGLLVQHRRHFKDDFAE